MSARAVAVRRLEIGGFGGPEVIRLVEDAALPEPGAGEVRIRAEASSLVFTDMLIRRNLYPALKASPPLTLGYDVVGRIDGVGPGVTRWRIGDRVADLVRIGGNATHLVRPAATLVAVPEALDAIRAEPLILSYTTAYQALFREAEAKPGDPVLVCGASGAVGQAALDLCRAFGLPAVGVASARRARAVTGLGAAFVAYDEADASGKLDRLSRGFGGFRAIVDAARGEPLSRVTARLAPGGRLVALGFSAPFRDARRAGHAQPGPLALLRFAFDFLRIKWLSARPGASRRVGFYDISARRTRHPDWFEEDLSTLFRLLEAGRIAPRIHGVFGLEEAVEAHRLIEAGQVEGRFVLDLAPPIGGDSPGRARTGSAQAAAPRQRPAHGRDRPPHPRRCADAVPVPCPAAAGSRQPGGGRAAAPVVGLALSALLSGCMSAGDMPPPPDRVARGWSDPTALAPVGDFDAYVARVTNELRTHRLAFDPSAAEAELASVAPFRLAPGPGCGPGAPRGIAILIHGLSDSAFAMRDLADSLSRQCFESRALLLPGHGTRPADLMAVDHEAWLSHAEAAASQARRESDFVVLAGFSLGAALALTVAAGSPGDVDAVIGLSPAYRIRSSVLARQARWIAPFRPWLGAGRPVEFARYGATPTRGLASTMALLGTMDVRTRHLGTVRTPWLVVQSEDDEVLDVAANRRFFDAHAGDPRSRLVNYFSRPPEAAPGDRITWLPAADAPLRVVGMSHLAVHISPWNPHYGISGTYRNCGSVPFREEEEVRSCRQAVRVWYGVAGQSPPAGEAGARSTFNPHYPDLERRIGEFLDGVDGRRTVPLASRRTGR